MKKFISGAVCALFLFASSAMAGPVELVTVEEAGTQNLDDASIYFEASMIEGGPGIEIVSPQKGHQFKGAVPVNVRFIKKEGAEIDLATFKLEYLKLLAIDLTPRVKQYVTKDGINVPEAKLPAGSHTIRLSVGDTTGAVTRQVVSFEVL